MVDVVGRLRVQVADRVVADGGEMDHRVEADQVLGLDVSDIHLDGVDLGWLGTEGAGGEQVGVEPRLTSMARPVAATGTSTEPM